MGMLKYKGYTGSVEYSDEDKCLFGKIQGLPGILISYEGTTIEEITNDFHVAVDDYLESCKERDVEPA
ncbi:MAG: type II toxin-antitoxin system HicB family antitoxin [Muribaculaceae bacterium]